MTENRFISKFSSKSDVELEHILQNSVGYTQEARFASFYLLKQRNVDLSKFSDEIKYIKKDIEIKKTLNDQDLVSRKRIIKRLRIMKIQSTRSFQVNDWSNLIVKRKNKTTFSIRMKHHLSFNTPVVICKIQNDSKYFCYPFFHFKPLLILGLIGTILMPFITPEIIADGLLNKLMLIPICSVVFFQIILMPITYIGYLRFFEKKFEKY
jgi:hypothetical protein